jgi:hypothetical protein
MRSNNKVRKIVYEGDSQFLLSKYYLGDEMERDQMGEICGIYLGMKRHTKFRSETGEREIPLRRHRFKLLLLLSRI